LLLYGYYYPAKWIPSHGLALLLTNIKYTFIQNGVIDYKFKSAPDNKEQLLGWAII